MSCDEVHLEAMLPVRGAAGGAEAAARHLTGCPMCRERLRVMVCVAAVKRSRERAPGISTARWLAAAAALLGLILVGAPPSDRRTPSPSALSTETPYPRFPLATRSRSVDPTARELGLQAYQAGDFEEAVKRLSGRLLDPEASFFLGVSLYLSGRPGQALAWLEDAQKRARWRRPALWYRANALLAMERTEEARKILESLAAGVGEFQLEADRLLKQPTLRSAHPKGRR